MFFWEFRDLVNLISYFDIIFDYGEYVRACTIDMFVNGLIIEAIKCNSNYNGNPK